VTEQKQQEESVYRNAFSLALWDGASDEQAHIKAEAAVEKLRKQQEAE